MSSNDAKGRGCNDLNEDTLCLRLKRLNKDCKYIRNGRAMAQAASRWPPTAEARVRSRVSPRGICGGQVALGLRYSRVNFITPEKN
jgi:hypothetical protein